MVTPSHWAYTVSPPLVEDEIVPVHCPLASLILETIVMLSAGVPLEVVTVTCFPLSTAPVSLLTVTVIVQTVEPFPGIISEEVARNDVVSLTAA